MGTPRIRVSLEKKKEVHKQACNMFDERMRKKKGDDKKNVYKNYLSL